MVSLGFVGLHIWAAHMGGLLSTALSSIDGFYHKSSDFYRAKTSQVAFFEPYYKQRSISRDVRRTRFFEKIEFEVLRGNLTRLSRIPFPNRMCTWKV